MARLIEFPHVARPMHSAKTAEQIIAELAPTIQTEEALHAMLLQVDDPLKRPAIEKCLRQHGACKVSEHPAC